jgi:phosphoglycerate dehydrogenase-like enzyme
MRQRITVPDDFPKVLSGTEAEEKLLPLGDVKIYLTRSENQEELIARIKESEAVINIRAYTKLTKEVLSAGPKLRLVSIWGTGTDNVDLDATKELGITVTSTPIANALSVAEHTLTILLALARQIPKMDRETRLGQWPRGEMVQMTGKVMGIIGLGAIGTHLAWMAKGHGMDVLAWTEHPSPERAKAAGVRFVSKEELLKTSDAVCLLLRLKNQTRGFFTKGDFDLMKKTAFFVNTGRAGLVEPGALYDALQSNKIAGAALDVFDQEPIPAGDPLTKMTNVLLTPHNAGMTPEAIINGLITAVQNVDDFFAQKEITPSSLVLRGTR